MLTKKLNRFCVQDAIWNWNSCRRCGDNTNSASTRSRSSWTHIWSFATLCAETRPKSTCAIGFIRPWWPKACTAILPPRCGTWSTAESARIAPRKYAAEAFSAIATSSCAITSRATATTRAGTCSRSKTCRRAIRRLWPVWSSTCVPVSSSILTTLTNSSVSWSATLTVTSPARTISSFSTSCSCAKSLPPARCASCSMKGRLFWTSSRPWSARRLPKTWPGQTLPSKLVAHRLCRWAFTTRKVHQAHRAITTLAKHLTWACRTPRPRWVTGLRRCLPILQLHRLQSATRRLAPVRRLSRGPWRRQGLSPSSLSPTAANSTSRFTTLTVAFTAVAAAVARARTTTPHLTIRATTSTPRRPSTSRQAPWLVFTSPHLTQGRALDSGTECMSAYRVNRERYRNKQRQTSPGRRLFRTLAVFDKRVYWFLIPIDQALRGSLGVSSFVAKVPLIRDRWWDRSLAFTPHRATIDLRAFLLRLRTFCLRKCFCVLCALAQWVHPREVFAARQLFRVVPNFRELSAKSRK